MKPFDELRCQNCNETGTISLDLDDLKTCRCRECNEEISLDDAIKVAQFQLDEWLRVHKMVQSAS